MSTRLGASRCSSNGDTRAGRLPCAGLRPARARPLRARPRRGSVRSRMDGPWRRRARRTRCLRSEEIVGSVGGLIESGKVRAWGTGNWEPADHAAAAEIARAEGVPPPCAAQLPYSLALRNHVEGSDAIEALDASGAAVVASYVLYGGVLTGKYSDGSASGRMTDELDDPELQPVLEAAHSLGELAPRLGTSSAALALAFALANPRVATVLFGATSPEQVTENVRAVELLEQLEPAALAELQAIT